MRLTYKATNAEGKILQGVIEAKTTDEAAKYLRSKNMYPIQIREKHDVPITAFIPFLNKTEKDLVVFTRQLSSMINSGLTLMQSINILKDQIQTQHFKEVIRNIITDVEDGLAFSKALERHPEIFSKTYVALIRASEVSGLMDKVLSRLADNLEKEQKLKSTVRGALLYPIIVIIGIAIVMAIMMIFVIPQLTPLYSGLNVKLPLATQIVVNISNFMVVGWPFILIGIAIGWFLFHRWHKTPSGKLIMDSFLLKLPIFGPLIRDSLLTEVTRTFGLLTGAGILVVESLQQTAETASNTLYKNALLTVSQNVEKGVTVGEALSYSSLFSPIIIEMTKVGEETGKLDESLLRVSLYYEEEVDQRVKNLTTLMEPFILVILGVGVGFLLFAVIAPVYSILNAFS